MDGLVYMVINQTSFSVQKKSAAQESARNAETTPPRCAAPPTPETPCCCESGAHRLSVENWKFGTMDLCGWFQFQQVIIISYPWKNSVNKELSSLTWRQTAAVWRNKRLIGGGCYTNPQPWGGRKAYLDTQCILSWSDASTVQGTNPLFSRTAVAYVCLPRTALPLTFLSSCRWCCFKCVEIGGIFFSQLICEICHLDHFQKVQL